MTTTPTAIPPSTLGPGALRDFPPLDLRGDYVICYVMPKKGVKNEEQNRKKEREN